MSYQEVYKQKLTTADEAVKAGPVRRLGGLRLERPVPRMRWTKRWPAGWTS